MRWIGVCERAFDLMCARAVARRSTAASRSPTRQLVQAWIADRAPRSTRRCFWCCALPGGIDQVEQQAHADSGATASTPSRDVSLIKFHVAGVLGRVVDRAVQVHGALGLTGDTVLSYFYATTRRPHLRRPDEVQQAPPPPAASSSATRRAPEIRARIRRKKPPKICRHAAPAAVCQGPLRLHARNCSRPRAAPSGPALSNFPSERGDGKTPAERARKVHPIRPPQISSFQGFRDWCGMV